MPFNHSLAQATTWEEIESLGFQCVEDGTGDPIGTSYDMKTKYFWVSIDAWFQVYMNRLNPDSDQIEIVVHDLADLRQLIAFIED